MKYSMMVRSRPDPVQSATEKHRNFQTAFEAIAKALGLPPRELPPVKEPPPWDDIAIVPLTAVLRRRARADVVYQSRAVIKDSAKYDDYTSLEFDFRKISPDLMLSAFRECVNALSGYSGYICNDEIFFSDIDRLGIVDYRKVIKRIHPICFYDAMLLRRVLDLSPRDVVERLSSHARVEEFAGGVLVVSAPCFGSFEQMKELSDELSGLVGLNTR